MVLMASVTPGRKGKDETLADEFLDQNGKTVVAAIKRSDLPPERIDELIALETSKRKRGAVLDALNLKKSALSQPGEDADMADTKALEKKVADLEAKVEGLEKRLLSHIKP